MCIFSEDAHNQKLEYVLQQAKDILYIPVSLYSIAPGQNKIRNAISLKGIAHCDETKREFVSVEFGWLLMCLSTSKFNYKKPRHEFI